MSNLNEHEEQDNLRDIFNAPSLRQKGGEDDYGTYRLNATSVEIGFVRSHLDIGEDKNYIVDDDGDVLWIDGGKVYWKDIYVGDIIDTKIEEKAR